MSQSLQDYGLILTKNQSKVFQYYPALIACAVLPLGLKGFSLGIFLQRPVGHLILLCALIGWLGWFFSREKPLYRSQLGDQLLNEIRSNCRNSKKATQTEPDSYPLQFTLTVAVLGKSALATSPLADLWNNTLEPTIYSVFGWEFHQV